jgi:hypothetical protein
LSLWEKIQSYLLVDTHESVSYNLSADGVYSAKSAYEAQFLGKIHSPDLAKVWSIDLKTKCDSSSGYCL